MRKGGLNSSVVQNFDWRYNTWKKIIALCNGNPCSKPVTLIRIYTHQKIKTINEQLYLKKLKMLANYIQISKLEKRLHGNYRSNARSC